MGFREKLSEIARDYEQARFEDIKNHKIAQAIRSLPYDISPLLGGEFDWLEMRASAGMGRWAWVPWCAFLNPLITTSVQEGYFVVYLIDSKKRKIYLSLNQGTQSVQREFRDSYQEVLRQRAEEFRNKLEGFSFPIRAMDDFKGKVAEGYASGHIYGYEYDALNLPNETVMIENLKYTLHAYQELFSPGAVKKDKKSEKFAEAENSIVVFPTKDSTEAEKATIIEEFKRYIDGQTIERNSDVSKKVKRIHGTACECCGVDYVNVDDINVDISEVHHIIPISSLEYEKHKIYDIKKDFAVLCPNCHRLLHKLFPNETRLEIGKLKTLLNK